MSDMTIESAKETIKLHEGHRYYSDDMVRAYERAKGYLSGHASRDPEVAELKALLGTDICAIHTRLIEQLAAEREASRKLVELLKKAIGRHSLILDAELVCEFEEAVRLYATPGR